LSRFVLLLAFGTGCTALSPPPNLPRHASTLPMPEGTVALSAIVGIGESGFLEFGAGVELRAAYQTSADVEVGVGLGFSVAEASVPLVVDPSDSRYNFNPVQQRNFWGGALRAYTSVTPAGEHMALTTGIGLRALTSGLVSFTVDSGVTFGYPNDSVVPYGTMFLALSIPVRKGVEFGSTPSHPETSVYLGGLFGVGFPEGAHFLSLESGYAKDLRNSKIGVFGFSFGERYAR